MKRVHKDCWEVILNRLESFHDLKEISLVSNDLLTITDEVRETLKVSWTATPILQKLMTRFKNLKTLTFVFYHGDFDELLTQISHSKSNLEKLGMAYCTCPSPPGLAKFGLRMKSLKALRISKVQNFCDNHMLAITNSMPWLEELDISGNPAITDMSIIALAQKCKLLRKLYAADCGYKESAVSFLLMNCRHLICLEIGGNIYLLSSLVIPSVHTISNTIIHAASLSQLEFYGICIPDHVVLSLKNATIPLRRLAFSYCPILSTVGTLSSLLAAYPFLEGLVLEGVSLAKSTMGKFLSDEDISELSENLGNLIFISLSNSKELTKSTLYVLAKNCPKLTVVRMSKTGLGIREGWLDVDLVQNDNMRFLSIFQGRMVDDETVEMLRVVCPNLEVTGSIDGRESNERRMKKFIANSDTKEILRCDLNAMARGEMPPAL